MRGRWSTGTAPTGRADVPAGATLIVSVRTGSTATPDSTWTGWTPATVGGRITGSSRFLQYRIDMVSPIGVAAPTLYAVGFSHNGGALAEVKETQ